MFSHSAGFFFFFSSSAYSTVSGVNGPLVILDNVKVSPFSLFTKTKVFQNMRVLNVQYLK